MTLRQYAKKCGTTHQTVSTAIKSGLINKGWDEDEQKIIVSIADAEWGLQFQMKRANKKTIKSASIPQQKLDDISEITIDEIVVGIEDAYIEVERKKMIIQAHRELLKLKKESGELVNKDEVYKKLFDFGKELRIAFQAIPLRIIDQLLSLSRHEALKLLTDEINQVLEKLSKDDNRV